MTQRNSADTLLPQASVRAAVTLRTFELSITCLAAAASLSRLV
jgi:hypothetical protein